MKKILKNIRLEKGKRIMRQAISVSPFELRKKANELEKEGKELGLNFDNKKKWSVPILNKEPECSDTWEFE